MGDESFSEKLLKEKLTELNSSQQSIESLSKWCVYHHKKATRIVDTWESLFNSAAPELRVSLLYLSDDILQNSRSKGSEFVNEFWEVLPVAIKDAYDTGDENCRKVASRLVDIWEERKVFGNRGQNLKSKVLGDHLAPVNNAKTSNLIKVVSRDAANSVQIKLAVGGLPEKILTSMHKLQNVTVDEETALDKCHNALTSLQEIEKDAANASSQGEANGSVVVDNMQKHEDVVRDTISQLQKSEETRLALISQLKEALQDQETKLELIQTELLAAQSKIEQVAKIKLQLTSTSSTPPPTISHSTSEQHNTIMSPSTNPSTPLTNSNQQKIRKEAAASIAAKLAASVRSQLLTSVLSTLESEEEEEDADSESIRVKRPKLDPTPSDAENSDGSNVSASPFLQPPPSETALVNQSAESNITELPYNYGASNLSPQPPLSSEPTASFAGPGNPPQQALPPQPSTSPTHK